MVNTSFRLCPWADVLYAMDRQWWDMYLREVEQTFAGERVSVAGLRSRFKVRQSKIPHHSNSGAAAIALAAHRGAKRIIMLGYDCQRTSGKTHWHGDHPRGLGNAGSVGRWPEHFKKLAANLRGIEILNASRATALTCFPRVALEEALCAP